MFASNNQIIAFLFLLPFAAACGDDKTGLQKCEEIGELRHETDTKLGKECHEIGHDEATEKCEEKYDDCIEECKGG